MTSDKKFAPIEFARRLRNSQTSTEFLLWQILRGRKRYGLKFRRQHPIGIYTVDFCCLEYKLVIECDGLGHFSDEGKRYDAQRDRWFNEQGYQVLRFTGQQIEYQTQETLAILDQAIFALKDRNRTSDSKSQEPSPPSPLSHKNGRGGDKTSVMAQHQNQPVDRNDLELQIRPARQNRPDGFTLVELMAVIVIIGILTALVLGAMRGALIDSQTAKTRGTIAKIDAVLNEKMDEYLSKPLKFMNDGLDAGSVRLERFLKSGQKIDFMGNAVTINLMANTPSQGLLRERLRLSATRDLMRMELPDCVADLFSTGYLRANAAQANRLSMIPGVASTMPWTSNPLHFSTVLATGLQTSATSTPANRPIVARLETPSEFQRIVKRLLLADSALGGTAHWSDTFPNEELLYLIVEGTYLNGSPAIETFAANEIADTDGDGLFEFIDAWGTPIRWLRWPSGINNVAPFDVDPFSSTAGADAFDPAQADMGFDVANAGGGAYPFAPNYFPRPLVVSAGPDRRFGIRFHPVIDSGGSYITSATASISNVQLPAGSFAGPGYWPAAFNFPDPFWPRDNSDARLGALADDVIDTTFDPIGVDLSVPSPTLIANPNNDLGGYNTTNEFYQGVSQDNVSNLDESGASL